MRAAFLIHNTKAFVLATQLGYANGKQAGDPNMAREFQEVQRRHPDWIEYLGDTEKDADLMTGDLREEGLRVLNLNELKDKNEKL